MCFLLALNRLPIGILAVLDNTSPFWAIIIGYIFMGEILTKFELIATIISFGGIVILAMSQEN